MILVYARPSLDRVQPDAEGRGDLVECAPRTSGGNRTREAPTCKNQTILKDARVSHVPWKRPWPGVVLLDPPSPISPTRGALLLQFGGA